MLGYYIRDILNIKLYNIFLKVRDFEEKIRKVFRLSYVLQQKIFEQSKGQVFRDYSYCGFLFYCYELNSLVSIKDKDESISFVKEYFVFMEEICVCCKEDKKVLFVIDEEVERIESEIRN